MASFRSQVSRSWHRERSSSRAVECEQLQTMSDEMLQCFPTTFAARDAHAPTLIYDGELHGGSFGGQIWISSVDDVLRPEWLRCIKAIETAET